MLHIQAQGSGPPDLGISSSLKHAIDTAAEEQGLDARLLKAIALVESTSGNNKKLNKNKNGTQDVGPFQINSIHWTTTCRHLDLKTNLGNARCAAILLKRHKRFEGTDSDWACRYHSTTPRLKMAYCIKLRRALDIVE